MKLRFSALTLLTTAIVAMGVAAAPPGLAAPAVPAVPARPAVVLVNQPTHSLCAGHKIKVGVWYQSVSGGSRAYRVSVWGPRHTRFFYRSGQASSARWKFWNVLAGRHGRYHVVYAGHKPGSATWTRFTVTIMARRCAR